MECLAGALLGGVIGLGSALGVTEYRAWRERELRKTDLADMCTKDAHLSQPG